MPGVNPSRNSYVLSRQALAGSITRYATLFDDTDGLTILELRAKARRMKQRYGIALFVVDSGEPTPGIELTARSAHRFMNAMTPKSTTPTRSALMVIAPYK